MLLRYSQWVWIVGINGIVVVLVRSEEAPIFFLEGVILMLTVTLIELEKCDK